MDRVSAVGQGVAVHVVRFGIIVGASFLAPSLGITGWWIGLFVNVLCAVYAAALVTLLRLWRRSGIVTLWRSRGALLFTSLLIVEATIRFFPSGLRSEDPGFSLWALSLLLVGFNEELTSRVVVLDRLRRSFGAYSAVAITAALFGAQHLSAFATTSRGATDILTNVVASACYGFALAAFQFRYAWIWPLILIHATADFTTILSRFRDPGDYLAIGTSVAFVAWGVFILRTRNRARPGRSAGGSGRALGEVKPPRGSRHSGTGMSPEAYRRNMSPDQPSPDPRSDATEDERLHQLIQKVDDEHGSEGAASMADELRDRLPATKTEDEDAGDRQN